MANFAELDDNNVVLRVVVIDNSELLDDNGNEDESKGIIYCQNLLGGRWLQTSISGRIRVNCALPGMVYIEDVDAFVYPSPKPWYVLNANYKWECPIGIHPDTGEPLKDWQWDYLEVMKNVKVRPDYVIQLRDERGLPL